VKLFMVGASPYARKVLVLASERGLRDRIEPVIANPHERPPELVAANPLSKVPTLVADDGSIHIDSLAICLYLDTLGDRPPLALVDGPERWPILQRHALANGVLDCSVSRRMESQLTPVPDRLAWMERQATTSARALDRFEETATEIQDRVALDTITLACALSYLDFRFPADNWRGGRPQLEAWHAEFETRPSMQATRFPS
jgi:glutathione S-transferase